MQEQKIVFTVYAHDRIGIVQQISDVVLAAKGNWLESSLSRLCGQFVGIVHIAVSEENKQAVIDGLLGLSSAGIDITIHAQTDAPKLAEVKVLNISIEANDRVGIIEEVSRAIATAGANLEQLTTRCESASMAGYLLFQADMLVSIAPTVSEDAICTALENVSGDLMVNISSDTV